MYYIINLYSYSKINSIKALIYNIFLLSFIFKIYTILSLFFNLYPYLSRKLQNINNSLFISLSRMTTNINNMIATILK